MDAVGRSLPGLLPPDAPLAMPVQSFARWDGPVRRPRPVARIAVRRLLVLGGAAALAAVAISQMFEVLTFRGLTLMELVVLAIYALLVPWIALAFTNALAGLWYIVSRRRSGLALEGEAEPRRLSTLTALLVPTHNESAAGVRANLEAITDSLARTGQLAHFHVVVLSDSSRDGLVAAEGAALHGLQERLGTATRAFYRHREENVDLKAGNIADWVRHHGAPYAHFVILDADSLMEGTALVRLAAAMERHPDVGMIQTAPAVVGGSTLFARLQQFSACVYGPLITGGLAWWQGTDGNYWGHNAIVRTSAFAGAAGLPHLDGRKPFGGQVMSHDFVEAALVRRAGWAVRLAPDVSGSYEESPPSLVDLAVRDRRWCQGNLQHLALLRARGLNPVSRLHFVTGIFAYVASPLWLTFLLVGLLASLQARYLPMRQGSTGFELLALPAQDADRARLLFIITMVLLVAPKVIALLVILARSASRRACGGAVAVCASVGVETMISGLIAPVMMLVQSRAVASVLTGRDAGWKAQRRGGAIPMGEIVRHHLWHTVVGVAMGVAAWLVSPALLFWMIPVVAGLVLAIPISALTARPGAGRFTMRCGMFRTPEETLPPPVVEARERRLVDAVHAGDAPSSEI